MDPLEFLFGLEKFGIKFGLDHIRTLSAGLGSPHDAFPSVLIAGTNGKGSVAAMVELTLRRAGLKTGRYTSPHLVRLEERFAIDGFPVGLAELRDLAGLLQARVGELRDAGALTTCPTFFEVTTAIAFELFRRRQVDIAVLEVGLGGRFDATNIVEPHACAIVSIALDHEQFLGHTLAEVAREKAGILRPGVPGVVGSMPSEAFDAIADAARRIGAPIIAAGDGVTTAVEMHGGRVRLALETPCRSYGPVLLSLRGRHQADNAVVAVRLLEALEQRGWRIGAEAIRAGLSEAVWPGRLDPIELPGGRSVLLDAAHNPAAIARVAAYLTEVHPRGLPVVFAAMRDKDWAGMLAALVPHAAKLVATRPDNPRAAAPADLAGAARALGVRGVETVEPPAAALDTAWRAGPSVLATGSIFLVGELMQALERGAPDERA